ncbi:MAG TPA: tRNA (adenosine(37)-N6)-dimethylallyltransferase MiaA [Polyangiaceae bacterium]
MSVDDDRLAAALKIAEANPSAILAFVGPTASGKTDLAIRVAEALGGEIVSVDSVQVYRGFDIGSGKPTAEEQARARHHLIDVVGPQDPIDAARFAALANAAIEDVRARGKVAILCGGTFLWMKALLFGLVEAVAADESIRARHREEAATLGNQALHDRLRAIDPASADRLHPNDVVRVSRALEVHELTGRTITDAHKEHGFASTHHEAQLVAVLRTPDELTVRIRTRVAAWLEGGFLEETQRLLDEGHGETRAMQTVGYLEAKQHLLGLLPRDELLETIVRRTRVFARRQRTWLNKPGASLTWL